MDNDTQQINQTQNQNMSAGGQMATPASTAVNMTNTANGMPKKSGVGAVIATVIIIVLIVLGALYFWGKRIETEKAQQAFMQGDSTTTDETATAAEAARIETVSQDDSLNAIDSETKTTNTTNLSPELQ